MAAFHAIGPITVHAWRGPPPTELVNSVVTFVRPGYLGVGSRIVQGVPTPMQLETWTYAQPAAAAGIEAALIAMHGFQYQLKYANVVAPRKYLVERADLQTIDHLPRADAFEVGGTVSIAPAVKLVVRWRLLPTS